MRVLNQTFSELNLEKHPDKTLIGRVERGFDFLGYFLKPYSMDISEKTVDRFIERIIRLYEQEPPNKIEKRLGEYLLRWLSI
jgi:RNA-directed DNA polymerase